MFNDLTNEETNFLLEVLNNAWFALDVRNMNIEKRKMYSSIRSKLVKRPGKIPY